MMPSWIITVTGDTPKHAKDRGQNDSRAGDDAAGGRHRTDHASHRSNAMKPLAARETPKASSQERRLVTPPASPSHATSKLFQLLKY